MAKEISKLTIEVNIGGVRMDALRQCLAGKGLTLETLVSEQVEKMYVTNVPQVLRDYFDGQLGKPAQPKKPRPMSVQQTKTQEETE